MWPAGWPSKSGSAAAADSVWRSSLRSVCATPAAAPGRVLRGTVPAEPSHVFTPGRHPLGRPITAQPRPPTTLEPSHLPLGAPRDLRQNKQTPQTVLLLIYLQVALLYRKAAPLVQFRFWRRMWGKHLVESSDGRITTT